ncbi:MAG: hypothetical protein ACRD16_08680, partial [Thermoanaerobaculia bacterium]
MLARPVFAALAALSAAVLPSPGSGTDWTLIRAGLVIDGRGRVEANQAIWIEGDRIREIGPAQKVLRGRKASREIDLSRS